MLHYKLKYLSPSDCSSVSTFLVKNLPNYLEGNGSNGYVSVTVDLSCNCHVCNHTIRINMYLNFYQGVCNAFEKYIHKCMFCFSSSVANSILLSTQVLPRMSSFQEQLNDNPIVLEFDQFQVRKIFHNDSDCDEEIFL